MMSGSQAGPWLFAPGVNKAVLAAQLPSPWPVTAKRRGCFWWGKKGEISWAFYLRGAVSGSFSVRAQAQGARGGISQQAVTETKEGPAVSDERRN